MNVVTVRPSTTPLLSPRALFESFSEAPRTLRLVGRLAPVTLASLVALTALAATTPLGVAYVGKRVIDAVVAHERAAALKFVVVELCLVALLSLAQRGLALSRSLLTARLSVDVNVMILEKAQAATLSRFEDPEFYDQLTRARREASSRPIAVVMGLLSLAQNAVTLLGYAALLSRTSGWALLGLLLSALPATIAEVRLAKDAFRLRNRRSPETRRLGYLEYVLGNEVYAKEVRTFGLGGLLLGRYRELAGRLYEEDRGVAVRRAWIGYLLSTIATATFYGCYLALALDAVAGRLSLGDLTLAVVAFRQGQQAFTSVLTALGGLYEDNLYMTNLFGFLALPAAPEAEVARRDAPGRDAPGIVFEDVGFRYPGQERFALRHVSLEIPPGKHLAIVGQNGSGKTTLIKLLTRLYTPTEGRILVDGKDLRDWDEAALWAKLGVVFQDFARYQLSFGENVGVGSVPHLDDEPRILRAVERGGADELLASLPQGLETPLGRWFKREGVELSGGQWQRVALARAFMREEADVLILDEPTAALDAEAEQAVFERFQALAAGRTAVLISHRFPTVRGADEIVVLESGAIVEQGDHEQLLARRGRYARLFELQAEGYRLPPGFRA